MTDPLVVLDEIRARHEAINWDESLGVAASGDGTPGVGSDVRYDFGDGSAWALMELVDHARTDLPKLEAALRAILELHDPWFSRTEPMGEYCSACGTEYPCLTVRAISSALGGAE